MRLWHKDLISVLPDKQLVAQWRECCAIAGSVAKNGTPNHLLVNKILDYTTEHFKLYVFNVLTEMRRRGYTISAGAITRFYMNLDYGIEYYAFPSDFENYSVTPSELYAGWHNTRYLQQCYCNLQEKYDCGGISEEYWHNIENKMKELNKENI